MDRSAIILIGVLAMLAIVDFWRWSLGPTFARRRSADMPIRFTVVNLLCLMFLFSIPPAVAKTVIPPEAAAATWGTVAGGWVVTVLAWREAVRRLSFFRVRHAGHRAAYLAIVLPVRFYGGLAIALSAVFFVRAASDGNVLSALYCALLAAVLVTAQIAAARYARSVFDAGMEEGQHEIERSP